MIKTIIAGLVATTMLTSTGFAADSSHCNVLDKGPMFNKTILSDFDKCWLNTHRADKLSGVDGNVFWMKIDGKFISMPVKDLFANGSSKSAVKEIIKEKVITETITKTVIQEVNRLTESQRTAISFVSDFLSGGATNQEIQDYLLNNRIQIPNDAGNGYIRAADAWFAATTVADKVTVLSNVIKSQAATIVAFQDPAIIAAHIEAAKMSVVHPNRGLNVRGVPHAYASAYDSGFVGTYTPDINVTATAVLDSNSNPTGVINFSNGGSITLSDAIVSAINSDSITFSNLENAIEEAYNQGYSDGYAEGYADGYTDGFRDGVNSVR